MLKNSDNNNNNKKVPTNLLKHCRFHAHLNTGVRMSKFKLKGKTLIRNE